MISLIAILLCACMFLIYLQIINRKKIKTLIAELDNQQIEFSSLMEKYKALTTQLDAIENIIEENSDYEKTKNVFNSFETLSNEGKYQRSIEIIRLIIRKLTESIIKESAANESKRNLQNSIDDYKRVIEESKKTLKAEFENIANQILKTKSEAFSSDSEKKLTELLKPLKLNIESFQGSVNNILKENSKDQVTLKNLIDPLNENISQFTKALKGDFKVQGNWGETILERLLETLGFLKGKHYTTQKHNLDLESDTGQKTRPDFIFYLPEDKKLVIDSKVSIKHAIDYFSSDDQLIKESLIKKHLLAMRSHIKTLSKKTYQSLENLEGSLDFVIMFVPNDFALFSAFRNDDEIQNYALENKVMLLSPTLLMPFLQIIRNFWRISEISKGAMTIADESGKMFDKLCGFLDEFDKIKLNLNRASKSFDSAQIKLTGNKGVVKHALKVKELGAKATKNTPPDYSIDLEGTKESKNTLTEEIITIKDPQEV